jgi:hypothetical protein
VRRRAYIWSVALGLVTAAGLSGTAEAEPPACTAPPDRTIRTDPPVPVMVSISCSDPGGAPLTYVVDANPLHGSVEPNHSSPGSYAYMPAKGFEGVDAFSVRAESANGTSPPVEQRIVVDPSYNRAPWCNPTAFEVQQGRARTYALDCFDPDGDELALSVTRPPSHGSVVTGAFANVTYTAPARYVGEDGLAVEVDDGHGGKAVAELTVTVVDHNQAPVCRNHDTVARSAKTDPVNFAGACFDPDGDPLTFAVVTQPAHGYVSRPDGGAWQITTERFLGPDRFTMLADDGVDQTIFAVNLRIVESGDTLPECASRQAAVKAGGRITIQLQCFDRDLDVPWLRVWDEPAPGTGTLLGIDQRRQTVEFWADERFTGTARFTYGAEDALLGPSPPATVEIDVTDGVPPALSLAPAARQRVRAVLAKGVAMVVRLDEPARLSVRATVDARTARRLGLPKRARRAVEVGRVTRRVAAGRTTVRVRLGARARRALRRSRKATTVRLVAVATDAAGNRRELLARAVVRR